MPASVARSALDWNGQGRSHGEPGIDQSQTGRHSCAHDAAIHWLSAQDIDRPSIGTASSTRRWPVRACRLGNRKALRTERHGRWRR